MAYLHVCKRLGDPSQSEQEIIRFQKGEDQFDHDLSGDVYVKAHGVGMVLVTARKQISTEANTKVTGVNVLMLECHVTALPVRLAK